MHFPSVTVIMYHYVRDLRNSKYPEIKGLDNSLFLEQLNYIKKKYNVVRTEELIEALDGGKQLPQNAALLTFDDGYADHYQFVFPALKSAGFQGSFYIPAKAVIEHQVLDVNKIHFILAGITDKQKIIQDIILLLDAYRAKEDLHPFEVYYKKLAVPNRFDTADVIFIKRLLQVELPESIRREIVGHLFSEYVSESEADFAKTLYLSQEQIHEMQSTGMHIGCHGYNHYWWNRLSREELDNELNLSLNFLQAFGIDRHCWTAAYPYGSYSLDVEKMLDDKGCKMAFTTEVGEATLNKHERLKMKRLDTNDILKNNC